MTDPFLARFQVEADSPLYERGYHTHCCFCSLLCRLHLRTQHWLGTVVGVEPDRDYAPGAETACHKGMVAHEHARHAERLQHPVVRATNGDLVPVSWTRAVTHVGKHLTHLRERFGPESIAVYGGSALTNEAAYLLSKFARMGLRTPHLDSSSRHGATEAERVLAAGFGSPRKLPFCVEDIGQTDYLVLIGSNVAETHPPLLRQLERIKERRGTVVVLDPRRTATAEAATEHHALRPGSDFTFLQGVAQVLDRDGLLDGDFITDHTTGLDSFVRTARSASDVNAEQTGLSREVMERVAHGLARARRAMILTGRGLDQQESARAVLGLAQDIMIALGKAGKFASGFGVLTGPGNGQGTRDQGLRADGLPGGRSLDNPDHRRDVAAAWGIAPEDLPMSVPAAPDLWRGVRQGQIKALIVAGANPALSEPDAEFMRAALAKLRFLVVLDLFHTATTAHAHVVLPACAWTEAEGTATSMEGRVVYRPKVQEPLGKSLPDWMIVRDLARQMDFQDSFRHADASSVYAELAEVSRDGPCDYTLATLDRVKAFEDPSFIGDEPRHYAKGARHPDGKLRFSDEQTIAPRPKSEEFPLALFTGKQASHYLTGTLTRRTVLLQHRSGQVFAEISEDLCGQRGLRDGALIRVRTAAGAWVVPVRCRKGMPSDAVFLPVHAEGAVAVNQLISRAAAESPELKWVPADIQPLQ